MMYMLGFVFIASILQNCNAYPYEGGEETNVMSIKEKDNCFAENKNSIGNDIDVLLGTISDPIEDAEACQKLCQQRRECEYFVFAKDFYTATLQGQRDVCWLKSSKSSLISYDGFVFGPKKCSEEMPKKECCSELQISSSNIKLNNVIKGKYEFYQMYNGAPAYKRKVTRENWQMREMYLYWANNRWMVWRNLGQTYTCKPWWAFWNCHEVYGQIRYEYEYQCPEQIGDQWKSFLTHNIDTSIQVRCTQDDTETTTTKPAPTFLCGRKPHRIVGGSEAGPYSLPWQVGLVRKNSQKPFCGGTLISNRHILTAAHCTRAIPSFNVVVGEHNTTDSRDGTIHTVSKIVDHPSYSSSPPKYDFAIVTLAKPVSFNTRANAACLPSSDWDEDFLAGKELKVSGWGVTSESGETPPVLHHVTVLGLTNFRCNQLYPRRITDQMLCAGNVDDGGVDSCQGDSGGPLTYSRNGGPVTVVGVVSWGIGCARPGQPGVYSRVTEVLEWINENMN